MAKSLRDQLIKSGAANADKKGGRGKKQKAPKAAKKDRAPGSMNAKDTTPDAAQLRIRQQAERDRALNQQRQQQLAARELVAQIKQLIQRNTIDLKPSTSKDGDAASDQHRLDYNFSDDSVVRKINLPEKLHRRVVAGTVAIARLDDSYHLVARPVAEKISERDDSYIVVMNDDESDSGAASEEDEYAGYEIPDDLMW